MFDQTQAESEGWCVTECTGSSYYPDGWMDIQKNDESEMFENDWDALAFVALRAASGSPYHRAAIRFAEKHNFSLIKGA